MFTILDVVLCTILRRWTTFPHLALSVGVCLGFESGGDVTFMSLNRHEPLLSLSLFACGFAPALCHADSVLGHDERRRCRHAGFVRGDDERRRCRGGQEEVGLLGGSTHSYRTDRRLPRKPRQAGRLCMACARGPLCTTNIIGKVCNAL